MCHLLRSKGSHLPRAVPPVSTPFEVPHGEHHHHLLVGSTSSHLERQHRQAGGHVDNDHACPCLHSAYNNNSSSSSSNTSRCPQHQDAGTLRKLGSTSPEPVLPKRPMLARDSAVLRHWQNHSPAADFGGRVHVKVTRPLQMQRQWTLLREEAASAAGCFISDSDDSDGVFELIRLPIDSPPQMCTLSPSLAAAAGPLALSVLPGEGFLAEALSEDDTEQKLTARTPAPAADGALRNLIDTTLRASSRQLDD
ncbi:hypothetical protein JKP88DRAFT_248199 [Tribonema minus]|uniref:Uncharacterized protein n=1 Tax=Tribonema minus TaxID=303371 RepID=A0A836CAI7_9STRA|nr:hypothetical protein JKP88DRAFT_248199 [Tribonema minus]